MLLCSRFKHANVPGSREEVDLFTIRLILFALCHYIVEFYRGDDRIAVSKV
jgi:hypothetical protein